MAFDLHLFDLDGTLLRTDDLERYRGTQNCGPQSAEWQSRLASDCHARRDRVHYTQSHVQALGRGRKIGVFTKSPRAYAEVLLRSMYPSTRWDTLVAFEDVRQTKPSPEGVITAMRVAGVSDARRVALIGDDKSDVVAAHLAGCFSVLDNGTWSRENSWAIERMPDLICSGPNDLREKMLRPDDYLPELERLTAPGQHAIGRAFRVDKWRHKEPSALGDGWIYITALGRKFSNYTELRSKSEGHVLTAEIEAYKSAIEFPGHWITALRNFIRQTWAVQHRRPVVVSVVPFKPGRPPRLEALLAQLSRSHQQEPITSGVEITFNPNLFRYREGVRGHSGEHLDKVQRFANVRDHLDGPEVHLARGKHAIVIDDVATTGASLLYADRLLRGARASNVECVALTHAIGNA